MATLHQKKQKQKKWFSNICFYVNKKIFNFSKTKYQKCRKIKWQWRRSVTVTNPEIVDKLSKLIKHSKIISQQSETTETPNIFDI